MSVKRMVVVPSPIAFRVDAPESESMDVSRSDRVLVNWTENDCPSGRPGSGTEVWDCATFQPSSVRTSPDVMRTGNLWCWSSKLALMIMSE